MTPSVSLAPHSAARAKTPDWRYAVDVARPRVRRRMMGRRRGEVERLGRRMVRMGKVVRMDRRRRERRADRMWLVGEV